MKVFLGGTCNNSTGRDEIVKLFHKNVNYFNPVVDDGTEDMQDIEEFEKENKCDIHLYVITNEMLGIFSIAEVVDSVGSGKQTILHILPGGFSEPQIKSFKALVDLVRKRGGYGSINKDLTPTAELINTGNANITW